jgi:two-component system sensor histidine kinase MtrB
VLRPIQRARDVAEEIAAGNLAARIPQATSHDDFGRLAESFNRMTDNLAQKIGELEHVGSLQARFVSDVSHELRTPLATVRMAADYIHAARTGLPPDAQRAAVLLERELERFENLLEDLLEISRFDAGVINLEPVEVDLGSLLDEVVDALDPIAHGRKVDVGLQIERANGAPMVAADPRRLDRVFSNLVKNAIEHTAEGSVRIWVGRRGADVVVTVADDGEGIPAEDLPHIFERFYRADVHRARTLGGTGLGLAIALENVNLHRGSISVRSEVGEGSTFTVTLPAIEPKAEPGADQAAAAEPQPEPEPAPPPEVAVGG